MIKAVLEISLAALLALPLHSFAAGPGSRDSHRMILNSEASLRSEAENIRLGRSVREFAEEFSMFDSQLYGSLPDKNRNQESMRQLNEEIRSTNSRLGQAMYKMDQVNNGFEGLVDGNQNATGQEIAAEVKQLENELAAMNGRMGELHNQNLIGGGSELLDGSLWDGLLQMGSTRELLDIIDKTLEAKAAAQSADSSALEKQ